MTKDAFRDPMQELVDRFADEAERNEKALAEATAPHSNATQSDSKNSTQKVEPKKETEKPPTPAPGTELEGQPKVLKANVT